MWKSALVFAAFVGIALSSAAARADTFGTPRQGFGIGIGIGTNASGLSGKFMAGPGAFQAVAGVWGIEGNGSNSGPGRSPRIDGVGLSIDYLFEMPTLAKSQYFNLDWCFGLGGGVGVSTGGGTPGVAAAGIAGLEFNFTGVPLDVAIEYRPTVGILPEPGIGLIGFTAHVRLWF
jgi:hypothetical protein